MKMPFVFSLICFCFIFPFYGKAQLISIAGFIKNASTGEVKQSAAIFESGAGIGTITNSEGYYRLLLNKGQKKLEISSDGFHTYTSKFNLMADTIISVKLVPHDLTDGKANPAKEQEYESNNLLNPKTKTVSRSQ